VIDTLLAATMGAGIAYIIVYKWCIMEKLASRCPMQRILRI